MDYEQEENTGTTWVQPGTAPTIEKRLYWQLISKYVTCPKTGTTHNLDWATSYNSIIQQLINLKYSQFEEFIYTPKSGFQDSPYIDFPHFSSVVNTAIWTMANDFGYGNPNDDAYPSGIGSGSGPIIHNNATATATQSQSQQQTMTLDQSIEQAVMDIRKHYGKTQADEAEKMLNGLKKNTTWENIKSAAGWMLDLGKDAFIAAIPAIIKANTGI